MRWYHQVSRAWMEERRKYLTATDVAKLLPFTPTGRKRDVKDRQLEVWAEKQAGITDDMLVATGAAARGHIMEPYAIEAFNDLGAMNVPIRHWDDVLIYREALGLAFSPDALSLMPVAKGTASISFDDLCDSSLCMAEVKSYAPAKHYSKALAPKETLEERWQIATAMAVCPTIEDAYLVLFNPNCKQKLFVRRYSAKDLEKEIDTVVDVANDYWNAAKLMRDNAVAFAYPCKITEEEIIAEQDDGFQTVNPY